MSNLYRINKDMSNVLIESKIEYQKTASKAGASLDDARMEYASSYSIVSMYGGHAFYPEDGETVYHFNGDVYFVPEEFIPVKGGMYDIGFVPSLKEEVYEWISKNLPYYDEAETSFPSPIIEGDLWEICTDQYYIGNLLIRRIYRYNALLGCVMISSE